MLATRYACEHRWILGAMSNCDHGDGTPRRKKCSFCGGALRATTGLWGAFAWREDGMYPEHLAVKIFSSRKRADAFVTARDLVVRWIPATDLADPHAT